MRTWNYTTEENVAEAKQIDVPECLDWLEIKAILRQVGIKVYEIWTKND